MAQGTLYLRGQISPLTPPLRGLKQANKGSNLGGYISGTKISP